MRAFPFTEDEWSKVESVALAVTNASLADDVVLRDSSFLDLCETLDNLRETYGNHPVLLETQADFESDPLRKEELYRAAIRVADRFELPTLSIRVCLAAVLIDDFDNVKEAQRVLMECQRELRWHDDKSDVEHWTELMKECDLSFNPEPEATADGRSTVNNPAPPAAG